MEKRVVIIGGGFAGTHIARKLQNHYNVTLIDSKDYFEFTPSVPRTLVEPQHIPQMQVLHIDYLLRTIVIKDSVIDVNEKEVITATHTFPYDYLVVCSGSSYKSRIKGGDAVAASRAKELASYAQKLRQSHSILIIGGGLVGVELASEIITVYPSKNVTIVHANSELMERTPRGSRNYAYRFLSKRKVKIVLNERVVGKRGKYYMTDKRTQLSADLAFLCTGISPNSKYLEKFLHSSMDARKFLKVNRYLQVEGHRNIFATGDITNIAEEKSAQNAEIHADIVAHNLEALEIAHPMKEYLPKPRSMVISLGKTNGIFVYGNIVIKGIIPAFMKQFIEWKVMAEHRA